MSTYVHMCMMMRHLQRMEEVTNPNRLEVTSPEKGWSVRVCVCACMRACVCACVRVCVCVCVSEMVGGVTCMWCFKEQLLD